MLGRRLLKVVNILIVAAVVLLAGVIFWFAWRPLPQTSGRLTAPLAKPATVVRDALGVPHIAAASLEDVYFLQGFVTAQDRMWQMDALRRLASGELSEIVGAAALESDTEARQLRLRRVAEVECRRMSPQDRAVFAAYARGVNFYLDQQRGNLPIEFTLLRYDPRPWSIVDSFTIGVQMMRTLSSSWKDEVRKRAMSGGDRDKVEALWPIHGTLDVIPGSNAWVVSPAHSATGKAILANDPHLEFSNPSTWHMIHLQCPEMNVSGVVVPGLPAVAIGHNDRIAWGITNLGFDVQDLYIEKLDRNTGRYPYRGQVEQATLEREIIPVKDGKPVELQTWVTRHGPVILTEGDQSLALKWLAFEPGMVHYPFPQLDRARNWDEFRAALASFGGPSSNVVYADVDGNIGYQVTGALPIRRKYTGDVPVDGASGEFEWEGYIPTADLPSVYNPPSGLLITANQNPFPPDYRYPVHGAFAPYFRAKQIRDLLISKPKWRPEDMLVVQKDVYSGFAMFLARQVVAAYDARGTKNPALGDAVALLRNWNGQMEKDTAAPFYAALLYQHLRRTVADRAAPGKASNYETFIAPTALDTLLRRRPAGWFANWDEMLVHVAADAADEATRMQGHTPSKWNYSPYMETSLPHPVGQHVPYFGGYFNIGPVAMSGSSTSVKQTSRRLGPSMRMVAVPGEWESSLMNITIGESGQILSSHFHDQWQAYYTGHSFPMQFGKVQGKSTLEVVPKP